MSKQFDVGGVLYPRPFRIRRLGHFGFNLNRLDEGLAFYGGLLGFQLTDETSLGKRRLERPRPWRTTGCSS
ncbi:MAG: VOC family protein [Burkholderiaceae bacterium]|nr:VOC family protein [Burkholderiaceae bacterium]